MPSCPNCGSSVKEEDRYCTKCGTSLASEPEQPGAACIDASEEPHVSTGELISEAVRSLFSPTPVKAKPSCEIYSRPPAKPLWRYLVFAVFLLAAGLLVGYGEVWIKYLGYTIAGFSAPILYVAWMVSSDRYEREPLSLVAMTFGLGAFVSIFAAVLNAFLVLPLLGPPGAAFVEEPLKLLAVFWLARHRELGSEFNDHLDGMLYGAAAGAGFGGLENFFYIFEMVVNGGAPPVLAVAVRTASSFGHIAWTAMAGRSLGLAKALRGQSRASDMIPGLVAVIPLHFLWNSAPTSVSLFLLLPLFIGILIRQVRTAQMDEARWDFRAQHQP
jgi:RsiW-degrading membrane proteinase PrsW (M82 family)